MAGITDLVAAFTGGDAIENDAYYRQGKRILDAQNSQALLDKRLADAVQAANNTRYTQNFENTSDLPDPVKYAVLAGLGSDLKSGQESIGVGKENEILEMVMQMIQGQQQAGAPPVDLMNMMIGARDGKLLGPTNVQVEGQAQADIGKTIADTVAAIKLGDARGALADKRNTDPTTGGIPDIEAVDTATRDLLWANPETLPVTTENNWFSADVVENLPLSDPRAAAQWADTPEEERTAMMQFLGPEFNQWRVENIGNDPALADTQYAIGKFLKERGGAAVNPAQQAVASEATQQSQQAQQARAEFKTPDELGAAIAAGVIQPGDVVMTPEGPRVVKAMQ